ncbi:hypothetical protein DYI23_14390 [Roseibium polysiphoniae]|uniref:Uncharacterized protein n=1 Tax=Roseibium polysiphoniae TaxID=2571221 RepID=A0A944CFA5_9HYPH|nr:hypothetical protein [Roseibium polysiphoniae]
MLRFDTSSNGHSASPNYRPGLRLTHAAAPKDREFPCTPAALKAVSKFARWRALLSGHPTGSIK